MTAPAAAPLRTVAPATSNSAPLAPAPAAAAAAAAAPVPPAGDIAALIASSPDPAAELTHLVLAVAFSAQNAAVQGRILHTVKAEADKMLKDVRSTLLAATADPTHPDGQAGAYDGFTVTQKSGARSISYKDLQANYPEVYDELVTVGNPYFEIKYVH